MKRAIKPPSRLRHCALPSCQKRQFFVDHASTASPSNNGPPPPSHVNDSDIAHLSRQKLHPLSLNDLVKYVFSATLPSMYLVR